jgi:TPR repeat protein
MNRRPCLRLGLGLLLAVPLQSMAGIVDIDSVAKDPAKAWLDFTASADFETAYSAYEVLDKVGYTAEGVDAEACRMHTAEVDEAVANAPVSIAVMRTALLCAEATGQADKATKLEAGLVALSREALKDGRQLPWPKPIRVLGPNDVYVLMQAAGLEVHYEYFALTQPARYFPLVVAAWDAEAGKEITYAFDYVDATSRIRGTNEYQGYPFYKNLLVDFFEGAQAKGNQLAAMDLQALRMAMQAEDAAAKVKALRVSAGYGGIQSLRVWIALCARRPFKGCGDGLEDILLGFAEEKRVVPMVMLAFLHAEGIVAKRNDEVADGLLAAAIRLSGEEDVAIEYLTLSSVVDRPKAMERKSLATALERPAMRAALAVDKLERKALLQERDLQALDAPSSNAVGVGHAWLSKYWLQQEKEDLRLQSLRQGADEGDPDAQQALAFYLMTKSPETSTAQALALMQAAALGGEASAMKYLSARAVILRQWKSAERWLMGAIRANDNEAMLSLANLYEEDHGEVGQTAKQAFDWYSEMSRDPPMADARRHAARMAMKGKGTAKDPAQAEKWLLQDAEAGDGTSQLLLAIGYLEGDLGAGAAGKAQAWIAKMLASNDRSAKVGYADWLYGNRTDADDRALARRLWTDSQHDEASWALNNMAWAYCTSVDPTARDAVAGMTYSQQMLKDPDLSWGKLDTIAACQAATGDYAKAVQSQQEVISKFVRYWNLDVLTEDQDESGFLNRLKLYQQKKPYLDEKADD